MDGQLPKDNFNHGTNGRRNGGCLTCWLGTAIGSGMRPVHQEVMHLREKNKLVSCKLKLWLSALHQDMSLHY